GRAAERKQNGPESAEEIGWKTSDKLRNEGKARRKAREGEYEGSVRTLRTQQRAKNQRQIS
ncbi:hypothetical protein, partial [Streptomyces narbonensis]